MAKTLERVYIYIYIWINLTKKSNRKVANTRVTFYKTYPLRKESRAWKKVRCFANHIRDG